MRRRERRGNRYLLLPGDLAESTGRAAVQVVV